MREASDQIVGQVKCLDVWELLYIQWVFYLVLAKLQNCDIDEFLGIDQVNHTDSLLH